MLQRRECNWSGVYYTTCPRNDVTSDLDRVVYDLKFKMRSLDRHYDTVCLPDSSSMCYPSSW